MIQRLGDHHGFLVNESCNVFNAESFSLYCHLYNRKDCVQVVSIQKCSSVKENCKHAQYPADEGFLVHTILKLPWTGIWVVLTDFCVSMYTGLIVNLYFVY